jgi:uncharacterized delta-60 repeat protein
MDIRFTLQQEYAGPEYTVTLFNLYGYTSGSNTPNLLASNVTKGLLLGTINNPGYIVTTNLAIVSGYIQPLGACGAAPPQTYSLVFSPGPIIVGNFSNYSGQTSVGIVKLNNDLTLDQTFNVGSGFGFQLGNNNGPLQIVKQANGKIVVAGTFSTYDGVQSSNTNVIRLNPDGSRDYTFNFNGGFYTSKTILSIDTQTDGKILIAGANNTTLTPITAGSGWLFRINVDGTPDTTFNNNVPSINGTVRVVLFLQNDNQSILIAGNFTSPGTGMAKIGSNGQQAVFAQAGAGTTTDGLGKISCLTLDSQNRIMIGGSFTTLFSQTVTNPVRVNSAGVIDTSWYPRCNGVVNSMIELPGTGGVVVAAGNFTGVNTSPQYTRNGIARLLPTGVVDNSIPTWASLTATYNTDPSSYWFPGPKVSLLSDGNILFYGNIASVNGSATYTNIVKIGAATGQPVTVGITYGISEVANYRDAVSI